MNRESGNCLVVIIGIGLILVLIGFFASDRAFWDTFNFKQVLHLPCGLTIENPKLKQGEKIAYPLTVDGYVNGCGWNTSGPWAGTAQILDGRGLAVSPPTRLIVPADSTEAPFYFSATLVPIAPPQTDTGNILVTSTTGLLYSIPVSF